MIAPPDRYADPERAQHLRNALDRALEADFGRAALVNDAYCSNLSEASPSVRGMLRGVCAVAAARRGDVAIALPIFDQALNDAEREEDAELMAILFYLSAWFQCACGMLVSARATFERAALIASGVRPDLAVLARRELRRVVNQLEGVRSTVHDGCPPGEANALSIVCECLAEHRLRDAYDVVVAMAEKLRDSHSLDERLAPVLSLVLRCMNDPLDAYDALLEVAAHGELQDAEEAVATLDALARRTEFKLVVAISHLSNAFLSLRMRRESAASTSAALAAPQFAAMGALRLQRRAMDVLVRSTNVGGRRSSQKVGRLTRRQNQIVALLRTGAANKQIASVLGITEHTVECHVSTILDELGLRSRWQLLHAVD